MERKEQFLRILGETKIIAVVRTDSQSDMVPVMHALYKGGVKIIEITSTSPNYLETIGSLKNAFGDFDDVFIGAGTILDAAMAGEAVSRRADFIVSPVFEKDVVAGCRDKGIPVMAGCMTPTEIYAAWKAGSDVIKTFPGGICTPGFYRDLAGPFPQIKMMPTGNVNTETAPEYIRAGAVAVGIGKALVNKDLIARGSYAEITGNAERYSALLTKI
ncbi:bifunctional 4-hydroxy-2-oxoglutarate aldolase/2-dehydro-3-deoxy-phosphogluconate aldolase [Breznakiella homolactica]|uniref:Bifunctional 4-hydroxy-2-oxoglutarate aldolase/2-dehydro-3-deoxy-phosphogluconate aldolase n=1 Tax=Breznakiella homolactica TaxID=2798577 RepID=A0A7T7XLH1_9SPIR|nr:bifunctional 4-hydroxy-2-oxoglutarate aldolase/2-dehydro-3-deoxy-phosphogluconate aldolase [Breznakiella homolactica]QQO08438.1 bifunctional 4-hydroxy-2-oxoglutarate aldolase/2-dehydro-3-deoxy-phosphogluconate aldolase [Breznakiella homolactica]